MPSTDHPLLAYAVAHGEVATLHRADHTMSSVDDAASALGIERWEMTKNLLFLVAGEPILCVAAGVDPVDRRRIAQQFDVGRKRVKLASAAETVAITGYEVGCVPPFGHKTKLSTVVMAEALALPRIYGGTADPRILISVTPEAFLRLTDAVVLSKP